MSRLIRCCLVLFVLAVTSASIAFAKVYWLPDYLDENQDRNSQRVNDLDDNNIHKSPQCSDFGWQTAAQTGTIKCSTKQYLPNGKICYSDCYDTCQGIEGKDCGDLKCLSYWQECPSKCKICETCTPTDCSDFMLTQAPANASYSTCMPGCGDNRTYYKISRCNNGYTLENGQCIDPCEGLVDNETDLGCEKYYDECPSKCEVGKTCKPNDCTGYTLTSCPTGASCESCTPGCGNETDIRYRFQSCEINYIDTNHWYEDVVRRFWIPNNE